MERLGDENLTAEEIEKENLRAKAIVNISSQIIKTARTTLDAAQMLYKYGIEISQTENSVKIKGVE